MRQLCFAEPDRAQWREVPDARLHGALESIIEPLVIGRCDLDVAFMRGVLPMKPGAALGHEVIGTVVEVGSAVRRFVPGQIVVVAAQISCGTCINCVRGFTGRCSSVPFAASYGMGREGGYGGAAADLVRVPFADAMLFALPAMADPVQWIGFADMAQDAWRAVGPQLAQRPGARVLILGGEPAVIGIYAAGLAVALGAGAVDYYDDNALRLGEAARYGAQAIERGKGEPSGVYEIVVDCCSEPTSLAEAVRYVEPEGYITSITAHLGAGTSIPMLEAYHKGIHLHAGRPNVRASMEHCCAICLSEKFNLGTIQTHLFSFDDAPAAWASTELRAVAVRKA